MWHRLSLRPSSWLRSLYKPAPTAFYDRQLLWLAFGLMVIGLVMVTSASVPVATRLTGNPFHFAIRHGAFIGISVFVAGLVLTRPLAFWQRNRKWLFWGAVGLLILVLGIGRSVNGAQRWIPLGFGLNIQPAEFAKLAIFIFMAGYLASIDKKEKDDHSAELAKLGFFARQKLKFKLFLRGLVADFSVPAVAILATCGLLLLQPDFGSVVVIFVTIFGTMFIVRAPLAHFVVLGGIGVLAVVGAIVSAPYRMKRVTAFLDPWSDPFGSGYQLTQSLMAFGRGGWSGEGLGNSIQKLEYLPEAHTDFVFSVLAEETGLIGVSIVLLLSFGLVLKALSISLRNLEAGRRFGGYLAFSIGVWFAFQIVINVGAASGLAPTKGLTLPLISYGGSSLLIMTTAVALLLRIDHEQRLAQYGVPIEDDDDDNKTE